ncbi:uncharacterized protein LOC130891572 [Diorhabda carinulata]|uniref:uncharacterized protein LOC130891572 n=1 Tax=Diorhabda carinulata TaxID=1163345 RepID=UPI00259FFD94|nr:uncharacterized protein LOC130891572 [Diorhabda carinulata]
MNLTVLILCITATSVYMFPCSDPIVADDNSKTEVPSPSTNDEQLPSNRIVNHLNERKLERPTETSTMKSNGTKFNIYHIVNVKENGCPTNYSRDPNGVCREQEN